MGLNLKTKISINPDTIKSPNLLDRFDAEDQQRIAEHVFTGYSRDKLSRSRWERRTSAAMDLAMQVQQDKTFPWPGAANVIFPLITIGALQFSAKAYNNIIQGTNIVRYRTLGGSDKQAVARATRIGQHMSWQVLEQDMGWEEQHDRLFINLAIVGSNFVKTYHNASLGYSVSELVMARDFVIDYWAKSVEQAARKTHRLAMYKNEIHERCMQGTYSHSVLDAVWFNQAAQVQAPSDYNTQNRRGQTTPQPDDSSAHAMLEQHLWLDLDGDGYEEPYICTIEEASKAPVRLCLRIDSMGQVHYRGDRISSITATEYFTNYTFIPSPDGGIYGLGFGTFLGPLNEAVNTGINQLLDAGTMQNSNGGFLGRGAKIRGGVYNLPPFGWNRVDSTGDDLRKNMVPFPDRQPADVVFKLVGLLIDYANRVAGTQDEQVGGNPGQNTPASTYQGMQETGMQTFKMIYKRVWRCMKEEFKKRYALNALYIDAVEEFGNAADKVYREDYKGNADQIAPVANPNITSTMMKFQQATMVKQAAMATPGYDIPVVEKKWLTSMEIDDIDEIYPGPDNVKPLPNAKLMIEQMKTQLGMAKVQAEKMKWANHLLEEQRLNNAKIMQLQAQAYALVKGAQTADVAQKLEALEMVMEQLKDHNKMIGDLADAAQKGMQDGQSSGEDGVPGLEGQQGNSGGNAVSGPGAGGAQGAVGGGGVSVPQHA